MTLAIEQGALELDGKTLLEGIDFSMASGRVASIVGANGAGKTSLLRLLAAERPPTRGRVTCDGEPVDAIAPEARARRLAVLPQHSVLDFPFAAREVIEMGRIPHFTGRVYDDRIVDELIVRLELRDLADRTYTTLSGGERQRVQIARVLCQVWDNLDRSYLLFDEPTAPLDLSHQLAFLSLARELASRGAAIALVMHDLNLASRFSDEMTIMKAGTVISRGTPMEVVTSDNVKAAFDVEVDIDTTHGVPLIFARSALG